MRLNGLFTALLLATTISAMGVEKQPPQGRLLREAIATAPVCGKPLAYIKVLKSMTFDLDSGSPAGEQLWLTRGQLKRKLGVGPEKADHLRTCLVWSSGIRAFEPGEVLEICTFSIQRYGLHMINHKKGTDAKGDTASIWCEVVKEDSAHQKDPYDWTIDDINETLAGYLELYVDRPASGERAPAPAPAASPWIPNHAAPTSGAMPESKR